MNPNSDPKKSFSIAISQDDRVDIDIYILRLRAQGLDLTPWASTYILANHLYKLGIEPPDDTTSNIPVLELGAGIGLVGLIAAIIWQRKAVLTELEPLVPGLAHIIQLNESLLRKHNCSAVAGALDWDAPDELILHDATRIAPDQQKANVIIAADTIYDDNHPSMLARTILRWLAPGPQSRVILTYPLRVAYLDQIREFWELLEQGGLESFQEGKEMAEGNDWDDERLCEWSVWKWKEHETNAL